MRSVTLKFKVGLYLAIALAVVTVIFTVLIVAHERGQLLQSAANHAMQLSEVITRSTRFAMLQNQPAYVERILHDVKEQEGIEKVRILSAEGKIIHSTDVAEIGKMVNQKTEACVHCHQRERPLERLPKSERTWTFTAADGKRLLGSMEVLHNEPSCYTAACHQHSKATTVLGVLTITYSLNEIEKAVRSNATTVGALSLAFAVVGSLSVALLIHGLVYRPLRDLQTGAERLAKGNLDQEIPVRSQDEFGQLATSFNTMTTALRSSQGELREWGRTLEQKVEKRTKELRVAEAEAVRGEKLASVGLLAAGVAHELNNPLTGILTFSHLVRKKLPDTSIEAQDLDLVIKETKRCAAIIRRLLDFSRDKAPQKQYADLNRIIEETARLVEWPAQMSDIEIHMDLGQDLPQIWVDADLIKQVIMNILVNAQQAIEAKGSITVRSRRCHDTRSREPGTPPVPMVELAIIDTGCGIPAKDLRRIFDPFFTSKEVGKGTGLGLSVSHGIVRAHGGAIEVESTVGEGSTFRVYLPVDPAPGETVVQASRSTA